MILGAIGIGIGFMAAPKTIEDVEKLLADSHHGHEAAHVEKVATHATEAHVVADTVKAVEAHVTDSTHNVAHATTVDSTDHVEDTTAVVAVAEAPAHTDNHDTHAKADVHSHDDHKAHLEHVLHQLQNKPWAALYVACIFFMLISVGVLVVSAVDRRLSLRPCQRIPPNVTARRPVAAAPTAAPSVALNQPAYMPVTTSTKTVITGHTARVGFKRCRHGRRSAGGAAFGYSRA